MSGSWQAQDDREHEGRPRIIFVSQTVDAADPVLGITCDLIRALGKVCDLAVIANEVRPPVSDLPARVFSLGKENGSSRLVRGIRYLKTLEQLTTREPGEPLPVLVAHMCPVYVQAAAPITRGRRVPTFLWYAQAHDNWSLRVAERLADRVLTTLPGSYPGGSSKTVAIGQAIDTGIFGYAQVQPIDRLRLLAIGRTSLVKHHDVAIRAVADARAAGLDVELRIVGPATTAGERQVRQGLHELIAGLGVQDGVVLSPGIPRNEIPAELAACHALVSTTADGSADKVIFEAMATGRPVLSSNRALTFLDGWPLRLQFQAGDPADLAQAIQDLAGADPGVLCAVGLGLRALVVRDHSLERWAAEVVSQARSVTTGRSVARHQRGVPVNPATSSSSRSSAAPREGDRLRVAIVTGIFPPDAGGPATHSADLARSLTRQGHEVTVITLVDGDRPETSAGLIRFPRHWAWPHRAARAGWWLRTHRDDYDVIYATGMHEVAAVGTLLGGRPLVAKVVGDPVWERACRIGLTGKSFDAFQGRPDTHLGVRAMTAVRNTSLRCAETLVAPNPELAALVRSWTGRNRVQVVPNGVPLDQAPPRVERPPSSPLRLIAVCRLVGHKRLDLVLEAVAQVPHVTLEIVGDGPEASALAARSDSLGLEDRVRFAGRLPHNRAWGRIADSDALVVVSDYEGLPHSAIEALACGTPVVGVPVGGLGEVVIHEVTGLVVEQDAASLAAAFRRLRDDGALRDRLASGARTAASQWSFERCLGRIESLLVEATWPKPRAVFVGRSSLRGTPSADLDTKLNILARHLEPTILTSEVPVTGTHDRLFRRFPGFGSGALAGIAFYALGGAFGVAMATRRGPSGVVCQSPYEGASALACARLVPRRLRPRVVVEVHGDWRTAARLYGGPLRRPLGPLADRVATWALRRADEVRTIGEYTEGLVREAGYRGPTDRYLTFSDYGAFLEPAPVPLPDRPRALFIGALERYKAVDVLLEAWTLVQRRIPEARLTVVGTGSRRDQITAQAASLRLGSSVVFAGSLPRSAIVEALDACSVLVLPSRSEGLGRVIVEAHARARPVVASNVGGIPELVDPGATGVLVPPEDAPALARALVEVLSDRARQERMGVEGRKRVVAADPQGEFAAGIARLADHLRDGSPGRP